MWVTDYPAGILTPLLKDTPWGRGRATHHRASQKRLYPWIQANLARTRMRVRPDGHGRGCSACGMADTGSDAGSNGTFVENVV